MELVLAVCYKYLRNEEEAKDGVMDLFEKLCVVLKDTEPRNFRSWLYAVVRNYCLMKLRRPAAIDYIGDPLCEVSDYPEEEEPISDASIELLRACIGRLPDNQRRAVELFFLNNKCYSEIASITGFELARVRSYLQNGKRNLKQCLNRYGRV